MVHKPAASRPQLRSSSLTLASPLSVVRYVERYTYVSMIQLCFGDLEIQTPEEGFTQTLICDFLAPVATRILL